MIRSFRHVALAVVALTAASGSFAADPKTYVFTQFFDNSTIFNPTDKKSLDSFTNSQTIAKLVLSDISGGVQGTLSFYDTTFPGTKLSVDELWLGSSVKGTVAGGGVKSGSFYKNGFYEDGTKFNYDIQFKTGLTEGKSTTFTIKGAGLDTGDFNGKIGLEVTGAGKPYSGLFGLDPNVHFIGTPIPEPSTYALMGLGLAGVAFVARKRKAA
jgi:hypothetical protein